MKQLKDRKFLIITLSLAIICIFTLTIAYAALNAVLTIQGSAQVTSSNWDVHFSNPKVTNGSATTTVPSIITSSTVEFSTTLNMPGDFYEFTVDVVNAGSIDAMIENVVKTPELTTEQAKFLKYEVSYQNGESITTKQLLAKDTTMPIKVRVEYRKDLSNTDLPTSQVVLDLALTLEYIQSDGTGTTVKDNGVQKKIINIISGDGTSTDSEVCIGEECFYVMYSDETTVTMLAKYNLYVGGVHDNSTWVAYGEEATGIQRSDMLGFVSTNQTRNGTIEFSNSMYWSSTNNFPAYVYNSNSSIYRHVENYKSHIEKLGVIPIEARLITQKELEDLGCVIEGNCNEEHKWVYSTAYWSGTAKNVLTVWRIYIDGLVDENMYNSNLGAGVRPVIVISKDYFN